MGLFEIVKLNKKGKEGKRVALLNAHNPRNAIHLAALAMKLPERVRVYPVRLKKQRRNA